MPKPIPHGTQNGYKNYGCRCDKCRKANTRYCRNWMNNHPDAKMRRARAARLKSRGGDPDVLLTHTAVHGEVSGINKHKRDKTDFCRPCNTLAVKMRNEKAAAARARRQPHGTESALRRHYSLGEKPCPRCRSVYKRRGKTDG